MIYLVCKFVDAERADVYDRENSIEIHALL